MIREIGSQDARRIRFPLHPQTVVQLKLIRFWLRAIAETCFEKFVADKTFYNPDIVRLILPLPTDKPIKFRALQMDIGNVDQSLVSSYCSRSFTLSLGKNGDGRPLAEMISSMAVRPDEVQIRSLVDPTQLEQILEVIYLF
jgi:hypothetical protein